MDVTLVAFESLGVRSMCTFVETDEISILIDPSAACHTGHGLKPHPAEYEALLRKRAEMLRLAQRADAIVTSHYHLDHSTPLRTDLQTTFSTREYADQIYRGKRLFCKDPLRNVEPRQRERGRLFRSRYSKHSMFRVADGGHFEFGETELSFSPALWHGKEGTQQGFVIGTCVRDGNQTLVHGSDVQLLNGGCVDWMIGCKPSLAVAAGPPIFDESRVSKDDRRFSSQLLGRLCEAIPRVVVDHHLLRSDDWTGFIVESGSAAECAATFRGEPVDALESRRKELFAEDPPDTGFYTELARGSIPSALREMLHDLGSEEVYRTCLEA